jgi:general secretion pathway protein D
MLFHCVRLPLLFVVLMLFSGCLTPTSTSSPPSSETNPLTPLVNGYPEPIDPALVRKSVRPAPLPPKIFVRRGESTLIYTCRATHCDVLKEALEDFISPEGAIESVPRLNKIIVKDTPNQIPVLLELLQDLDQPYPQLLIEARIVEITLENDEQFELTHLLENVEGGGARFVQDSSAALGTPGSAASSDQGALLTFRSNAGNKELDSFLRFLATTGKARILSSPNLIVGIGYQANLNTGEEVPIQSVTFSNGTPNTTTTFKNVGIKLRVTPQQITSDTARLEIAPEVSTVTRFTNPGPSGVSNPIVAVRNVRTELTVKDGELVTIGGLLRSEDRDGERKIPIVGDLPLVGHLFKSTRRERVKTALVFFLRMNILDHRSPDSILFHQPGAGLERLEDAVEGVLPQDKTPSSSSKVSPALPSTYAPLPPLTPEIIELPEFKEEVEDHSDDPATTLPLDEKEEEALKKEIQEEKAKEEQTSTPVEGEKK